jgi:seryl-tRNA synthetase
MLSLDFIRQNKEQVIAACKNKNRPADIEKLLWLDEQRKTLSQKAQN